MALLVPSYATLVVEPSYKITPLGATTPYPYTTTTVSAVTPPLSPEYAVAFDTHVGSNRTTSTTSAAVANAGINTYKASSPIEYAKACLKEIRKPFEEMKGLKDEIRDTENLIQQVFGGAGFNFYPFSSMSMSSAAWNNATATASYSSYIAGFKGGICDKCFMPITVSILINEGPPELYEMPSLKSLHKCKGELKFESHQAKQHQEEKSKNFLIDGLVEIVKKDWLNGRKILLVAKKIDYDVPTDHRLLKYSSSSAELISKVIKTGVLQINDEELRDFLGDTGSTAEIFFEADSKVGGVGSIVHYAISVQGQAVDVQEGSSVYPMLQNFFNPRGSSEKTESISNNNGNKQELRIRQPDRYRQ
jgi:hypothetical protein